MLLSNELFSNRILALLDVINANGLGLWELADDAMELDKTTAEMAGHTNAETLPFRKFLEQIHEEDRQEVKAAVEEMQKVPGRSSRVECRIMNRNDRNYRWIRIMGKSYLNQRKMIIFGTSQIIEGKALDLLNAVINDITKELNRKDELNQCIFDVTETLLNADELLFEAAFQKSLEIIARVVGLVRVYVYKNHLVEGILCCTEIHEWVEDMEPTLGEDYTKDIPLHSWTGLEESLNEGKPYNRLFKDVSHAIQEMIPNRRVGAVLFSPIFLKDMLWGFVGYERTETQIFSSEEESVLSSAGLLLANSLIRYDLNKNLIQAVDKINTTTIKAEVLEKFAYTDGLTGLYNRRHLMEQAQIILEKAQQSGTLCFAMIMDLDYFKKVNDTYGHLAGDEVLTNTAMIMKNILRPDDLLGRYGGEEFVVVIPKTAKENVLGLAERIRESIANTPCVFNCIKIPCTISIGVASMFDDCTIESLIDMADKGLYMAKKSGRNRVVFFTG
jgi:diguanylate cyclase (GGDEF)-like protein